VAIADLNEAQVGAKVPGPKANEPPQAVALEDAAIHQPQRAGPGPSHASQESAAVHPVVVVIMKNCVVVLMRHGDLLEATG